MEIKLGLYDAPLEQKQDYFKTDLWRTNFAIFGGHATGKTALIKTLLVRLHENMARVPAERIYIIDFGGNLGDYAQLENICACFDNSNEENIKRIFQTLDERYEQNAAQLGSRSYYDTALSSPQDCPPHVTLIIDNINSFLKDERYSYYHDPLLRLCRDGLSKGVSIVFTATDTSGLSAYLPHFGQKAAFQMPPDNYITIFDSKVEAPLNVPGRCIVNIGSSKYECQIFLPFRCYDDRKSIKELAASTAACGGNNEKLISFKGDLTEKNLTDNCAPELLAAVPDTNITVGLDYYSHAPIGFDYKKSRSIAIYGRAEFGKSNLLYVILQQLYRKEPSARFVFLEDGRNQVKNLYEEKYKENSVGFIEILDLLRYLKENGYTETLNELSNILTDVPDTELRHDHPFTVFVIQSKRFYRKSQESKYLFEALIPDMIPRADGDNYLFIFSDVKYFSEADIRSDFCYTISSAFLLDDIREFYEERGSGNKSVFGEMLYKEQTTKYAKCSRGDGFYYDVSGDKLHKLKFIKYEDT